MEGKEAVRFPTSIVWPPAVSVEKFVVPGGTEAKRAFTWGRSPKYCWSVARPVTVGAPLMVALEPSCRSVHFRKSPKKKVLLDFRIPFPNHAKANGPPAVN